MINSLVKIMGRVRKTRSFRLDEALIEGLNELAKRKNSSANRLLETTLYDWLKAEGILSEDLQPLGETRGKESND